VVEAEHVLRRSVSPGGSAEWAREPILFGVSRLMNCGISAPAMGGLPTGEVLFANGATTNFGSYSNPKAYKLIDDTISAPASQEAQSGANTPPSWRSNCP
jgi:hypothetical protein